MLDDTILKHLQRRKPAIVLGAVNFIDANCASIIYCIPVTMRLITNVILMENKRLWVDNARMETHIVK